MVVAAASAASSIPVLWIAGPDAGDDLALARRMVSGMAMLVESPSPRHAAADPSPALGDRSPAIILVGFSAASAWRLDDLVAVSRRWPLAPVVSVAATLVDGRRRSGPTLPGIEEVAWHDLPGRLAWWLRDRAWGVPGTLGMPATSRREERILEGSRRIVEAAPGVALRAAVAADRRLDAEALAELVVAAGHEVTSQRVGRPPVDHGADVIVWDTGDLGPTQIAWTSLLSANGPCTPIVLLDAFPRADTASAALDAGAIAVLGRPASLDALSGVLLAALGQAGRRPLERTL